MVNSNLTSQKCVPCESWTPPMKKADALKLLNEVPGWQLQEQGKLLKITKDYEFKDFKETMNFINKVAELAEEEGHHPDIYIFYNKLKLELATHFIKGLSKNDFILAAKINSLADKTFPEAQAKG